MRCVLIVRQPCPESVYYELTQNLVIIAGVTVGIAIVIVSNPPITIVATVSTQAFIALFSHVNCYAALLPRRGPHIGWHSVCPSVCPSVQLLFLFTFLQ